MKPFLFTFLFLSVMSLEGVGQDLFYYADVMRNAQRPEHRSFAADKFLNLFEEELESPDSYTNEFTPLRDWITVLYSADSTFRLITWQVDGEASATYHGYIQSSNGRITKLISSTYEDIQDLEYEVLSPTDWIGALYYDLVKVDATTYIALGYNAFSQDEVRKIADVISFEDGGVIFGKEIFVYRDDPIRPNVKTRIILQYSKLGAVRLSFDRTSDLLFFDHLVPVSSFEKKGEMVMVQDGSYDGYYLKGDRLYFKDKLFNTAVDEPPGGKPQTGEKRDLFGNPK